MFMFCNLKGWDEFHKLHNEEPRRDNQLVFGRKVDESERPSEWGDYSGVELSIRGIDRQLQWHHAV